jgi:carotenoid isomerooxygenase
MTEFPVIHRFNPETLETIEKFDLNEKVGIISHTAHPHVMLNGNVYNLGMILGKTGPSYVIICYPHSEQSAFENARIVAKIPTRWKFHPSYMHTFGITKKFFIIIEQPLTISAPCVLKYQIMNEPFISCFKSFPDEMTYIYLIDRDTGELKYTFHTETFFYFHIINQYEKDGQVVIDILCYHNSETLNSLYIDTMKKNLQSNSDYAKIFRGRSLRFVLPLIEQTKPKYSSINICFSKFFENSSQNSQNFVTLENSKATAFSMSDGSIFCTPELLCDLGCELPRINYDKYNGNEYRYFYAVSSDARLKNPNAIIKVDVNNKTNFIWCEKNCYPSEPIFIPSPEHKDEDDGVLLTSIIWGGNEQENRVGLLVLDAKTMTELGRCEFNGLPSPVPKCFHGWFAERK